MRGLWSWVALTAEIKISWRGVEEKRSDKRKNAFFPSPALLYFSIDGRPLRKEEDEETNRSAESRLFVVPARATRGSIGREYVTEFGTNASDVRF